MKSSDPGYNATLLAAANNAVKEARGSAVRFPSNEHMHAALGEEVGELANALIDHHRGLKTAQDVYNEAMQAAAMALRIALESSQEFDRYEYDPAMAEAFIATGAKKKRADAVVHVYHSNCAASVEKVRQQTERFRAAIQSVTRAPAFPFGDGQ